MESHCHYKQLSHQFFGNLNGGGENSKGGGDNGRGRRRGDGDDDGLVSSSKCWPCVDMSEDGRLLKRKLRGSCSASRRSAVRRYYVGGTRRNVGDAAIGRKPRAYVRCLICYTSLSGTEKVCTIHDIRKCKDEKSQNGIFPTFVNLLMKRTEPEIPPEVDLPPTEASRFKRETMKLAVKKPRVYLCSTCCVATQRYVHAHQVLKQLEEQVSQMRAKFITAIKLSDEMASQDDVIESPSREMKVVIDAVSFLRTCFVNGECPPEMNSDGKRSKRRVSTGLVWDVKEVLADLITSVEEMEEAESRQTSKSSMNAKSDMPQLKCEAPSSSSSSMPENQYDVDDHTIATDLCLPELDLFDEDAHFADDDHFDQTEQFHSSPPSEAETANDHESLDENPHEGYIDQLVDVPSSSIFTLKEEAVLPNKRRQTRHSKSAKTINTKPGPTDKPEILVGRELYNIKRKEKWAQIKSKYPGITYEKYKALHQKRSEKLQKCTNEGFPGRASIARQSWIKVPVKKVVAEDGEVKFFFKNVEIKRMEGGLFYCGICGQSRKYRELSYAKTHINLKHIDLSNGFECEHCGRKFYYHNLLLNHLLTSHHIMGKSSYQCEVCGDTFANEASRYSHKRVVHDGIKPHTCEYCGKSFGRVKDLTVHVRRHTGEKPFVCHVCAYAFVCKQTMKAHIMRRHPEEAKDLPPPSNPSTKGRRRKIKQEVSIDG